MQVIQLVTLQGRKYLSSELPLGVDQYLLRSSDWVCPVPIAIFKGKNTLESKHSMKKLAMPLANKCCRVVIAAVWTLKQFNWEGLPVKVLQKTPKGILDHGFSPLPLDLQVSSHTTSPTELQYHSPSPQQGSRNIEMDQALLFTCGSSWCRK